LTVSNGASVTGNYINVGSYAISGSSGTLTVTSGASVTESQEVRVGAFGTGTLTVSNGGTLTDTAGMIAQNTGATGTATITGTGSSWVNSADVYISNHGVGTLTIAEGGSVSAASGLSYIYTNLDSSTTPRTSTSTVYITTDSGSTGTLNIGAPAGSPAVAPGTLIANTVAFGAGTGTLVFNHTSSDYVF
jgi:T5SS/PEP-CTERM-associated repeat protein